MPINVIDEKTGEVIAGPGKKKKKKPTEWIKRKPTDVRKGLIDRFSGGVEGKPHSSEEGRLAAAGRKLSRIGKANRPPNLKRPVPWKKGKAAGGRIGLKHGGSVGAAIRGHGAEIK